MTTQQVVLKELTGLSEYLAVLGDSTAQNAAIDRAVASANARIRRELQLRVDRVTIQSWPESTPGAGVELEEPYDYRQADFWHYGFLKLRQKPVVSIQQVRVMWGANATIFTFPAEWMRLQSDTGRLEIVPTPGFGWSGPMLRGGQYLVPILTAGYIDGRMPQMLAVDYTAGIGDSMNDAYLDPPAPPGETPAEPIDWDKWADLRLMRARLAAREILVTVSEAVAAGVGSTSISEDGASESVNYTRGQSMTTFGARIQIIDSDWDRWKQSYIGDTVGLQFGVV